MRYERGITFGVFDLLHVGHVRLLEAARSRCDHLTVCVTTDDYAEVRKGRRPVVPFGQRCELVAALRAVDYVSGQWEQMTKTHAVERYNPDAIFVGDDWTPATFDGEGLGVPVVYLPYTRDVSSTKIREALT